MAIQAAFECRLDSENQILLLKEMFKTSICFHIHSIGTWFATTYTYIYITYIVETFNTNSTHQTVAFPCTLYTGYSFSICTYVTMYIMKVHSQVATTPISDTTHSAFCQKYTELCTTYIRVCRVKFPKTNVDIVLYLARYVYVDLPCLYTYVCMLNLQAVSVRTCASAAVQHKTLNEEQHHMYVLRTIETIYSLAQQACELQ